MDKSGINQNDNEKLIQIVNEFYETSPVPVIELLNKFFFQTEDVAEKKEMLKVSKLILNLYEVIASKINEKDLGADNSINEIN